jgi:hypothetical protein
MRQCIICGNEIQQGQKWVGSFPKSVEGCTIIEHGRTPIFVHCCCLEEAAKLRKKAQAADYWAERGELIGSILSCVEE